MGAVRPSQIWIDLYISLTAVWIELRRRPVFHTDMSDVPLRGILGRTVPTQALLLTRATRLHRARRRHDFC